MPQPAPSPLMSFMPMLVIIGIIYFLIIRPQQKAAKELKLQIDALKPGDRVLTQGGIFGSVVLLKGNVIQIKIAENVKVDVARAAITQIITDHTTPTPSTPITKEVVS